MTNNTEYKEFITELNNSKNTLCKRAATSIAHLSSENEKMKGQIKEAIDSVENGHEDDMGYNVLCSLGVSC